MSKFGEWFAWKLNRLFPPLSIHQELQNAKSNIEANQRWAYEDAQRVYRNFQPHWDLDGKQTLNVGHGLGGKLPFYVKAGARSVIGVDINVQSTRAAQQHVRSLGLDHCAEGKVALVVSDASNLPFCNASFDAVVSINTFEHITRLEKALRECHRVLVPNGLAFIYLPPYYSPWGPHLENWIHFPWPHLLFSDQTLMRVAAREDALLQLNQQFVGASQVDWTYGGGRIPDVNRVTLRQFRQMVSQTDFSFIQFKLLPFGHDFLSSGSPFERMLFSLLKIMSHIPLVQEAVVTKMACVLQKVVRT